MKVLVIAAYMALFVIVYIGAFLWVRENFKDEKYRTSKPLGSIPEIIAVAAGEIGLLRIWLALGKPGFDDLQFMLLAVMTMGMCVFSITDFRECIVPNKLLLIMLLFFFIILGGHGVRNMDQVTGLLPSIVLGLVFSSITFGLGYLIAKGSIGAGDVKLTLIMGLYLTGVYVVPAIAYGCLCSALFSIVQLIRKKVTRKDAIPFVPFLYIGLIIRLLLG